MAVYIGQTSCALLYHGWQGRVKGFISQLYRNLWERRDAVTPHANRRYHQPVIALAVSAV